MPLEDEDSVGVRKRAEAKLDAAQEEILKNKIKSTEDKLALSQKAASEAEAEIESTQKRLNITIKDFQDCRRKNEQAMETLAKQEQRENTVRADLSKLKLEVESVREAKAKAHVELEEQMCAATRER